MAVTLQRDCLRTRSDLGGASVPLIPSEPLAKASHISAFRAAPAASDTPVRERTIVNHHGARGRFLTEAVADPSCDREGADDCESLVRAGSASFTVAALFSATYRTTCDGTLVMRHNFDVRGRLD